MAQGRRRGVTFWLGIAFVATGLALLGYVGWQFFGTNIVAERRQWAAVHQLEEAWRQPVPQHGTGDQDHAAGSTPLGEASALVRIPAFGDDYVMPVLEGVADDALSRGFGHFERSASPGAKGNFALAAHRVTHGEPLRHMPDLRPGDEVVVETRDTVLTYELDTDPNDLIVGFEDVWVVTRRPDNPVPTGVEPAEDDRLITLTTCAELFHTDERMIVFGHLVSRERKSPT